MRQSSKCPNCSVSRSSSLWPTSSTGHWCQDELAAEFQGIESNKDIKIDYKLTASNQSHSKDIVQCQDYDLSGKWWPQRTRSDCMKTCLQDMQDKCTNCSAIVPEQCFFEGSDSWARYQMLDTGVTIVSINTKSSQTKEFVSRCNDSDYLFWKIHLLWKSM